MTRTRLPLAQAAQAVERVAGFAVGYERRWSLYTLRRLDPELHERFVAQEEDWRQALCGDDPMMLAAQTDAMCRGWLAVIGRMETLMANEDAYLVGLHEDTLVVISNSRAAASREVDDRYAGQRVLYVTPDEVAAMVNGLGDVALQVKEMWPGAEAVRVGEHREDPTKWKRKPLRPGEAEVMAQYTTPEED